MTNVYRDPTGMAIIAAATDVHRTLGPGLYERVYQLCLLHELRERGVPTESEVALLSCRRHRQHRCHRRGEMCRAARQAFLINFNGVTLKEGLRSYLGRGANSSPDQ